MGLKGGAGFEGVESVVEDRMYVKYMLNYHFSYPLPPLYVNCPN